VTTQFQLLIIIIIIIIIIINSTLTLLFKHTISDPEFGLRGYKYSSSRGL